MFPCDKCGACCRNLNLSEQYRDLDRGDGVCRFLKGNLCSIYDSRPLKCRIDACYELYFSSVMSKETYYKRNKEACKALKNK